MITWVMKCMLLCAWETHDALAAYEFMSDEVVKQAFDIVAPLLASFDFKQPLLSKYKAGSCRPCMHVLLCMYMSTCMTVRLSEAAFK